MWNMTGDSALICSVDCLTHTSPHVGASLGLPATLIAPTTHKPPCTPSLPFNPTRHWPHCSPTLPSVVCSPWPPQWGRGGGGCGNRAVEHSRYHQCCLWRIMLFIAFVRRALRYFVSLLPAYCHALEAGTDVPPLCGSACVIWQIDSRLELVLKKIVMCYVPSFFCSFLSSKQRFPSVSLFYLNSWRQN